MQFLSTLSLGIEGFHSFCFLVGISRTFGVEHNASRGHNMPLFIAWRGSEIIPRFRMSFGHVFSQRRLVAAPVPTKSGHFGLRNTCGHMGATHEG